MKVNDIINIIEDFAPLSLLEDWDVCGFLVGDRKSEVKKVLVALDVDIDVVKEAIENKVDMIVAHHSIMIKDRVTYDDMVGKCVIELIKNDIALYCAHTNVDKTNGGINDRIMQIIGAKNVLVHENGLVRMGEVSFSFGEFAREVETKLDCKVKTVGDLSKNIKTVAVCSGGGGSIVSDMLNCDVIVTGDIKYHTARDLYFSDKCVVCIDHYDSEKIVMDIFFELLSCKVEVIKSKVNKNILK